MGGGRRKRRLCQMFFKPLPCWTPPAGQPASAQSPWPALLQLSATSASPAEITGRLMVPWASHRCSGVPLCWIQPTRGRLHSHTRRGQACWLSGYLHSLPSPLVLATARLPIMPPPYALLFSFRPLLPRPLTTPWGFSLFSLTLNHRKQSKSQSLACLL